MKILLPIIPIVIILSIKLADCAPGDVSFVVSSTVPPKNEKVDEEFKYDFPIIYEMNINSNVSNRFAKTLIESKVKNPQKTAKEATFSVVLPEKAFISEFVMEIGGKNYKAYVKEKEEAKNIYNQAVSSGQSAAHVSVSARDSNRFTVSLNIEAEAKAAFLLTYEELLERKNKQYELVLNIHPGQVIKNLNVQVNINESRPLVFVKTPSLRSGNEINKNSDKIDPSSLIEIINKTSAVVNFHPDVVQQKDFAKKLGGKESEGLAGQFIVQYEVERDPHGGEVLLHDGYFVHFFAPKDTEPLPKNVYFILDTSGSMGGSKIQQLKDALVSILGEIKAEDTISIIEFNSDVLVWNIEAQSSVRVDYHNYTDPFPELSKHDLPGVFPASKDIVDKAKNLITQMVASGGTYMIGGLEAGLYLVKSEIDRSSTAANKKQPIIIFLTDGEPNGGLSSTEEITNTVTRLNKDKINVPIFSLSFGEGADKSFLRKLSIKNLGFSRHIYDAADASLQLQEFYKQISSPLLSNIDFKYDSEVKDVTKKQYPILFEGSEIIVAGRYDGPQLNAEVNALGRKGKLVLTPKREQPVSSLERLWAYLTVKETLEKREASDSKTELTKKALDLALKYSFVTDVSSLVVVKPNATNDVKIEDASKPNQPQFYPRAFSKSAFLRSNQPNFYHSQPSYIVAPHPRRQYLMSGSADHFPSSRIASSYDSYDYDALVLPHKAILTTRIYGPPTAHFTTPVPLTTSKEAKVEDSLHWLVKAMNANRTLTLTDGVYELGDESLTIPVGGVCPKTPKGEEGKCTLIKDCPEVFSLLTDFDTYKQFFCPVQTKYAGVCCPKK